MQSLYTAPNQHIFRLLKNLMRGSPNAVKVEKARFKDHQSTRQEKNDIKDVVIASSHEPNLDFHPEIHRLL